jgi:hypothetical protein
MTYNMIIINLIRGIGSAMICLCCRILAPAAASPHYLVYPPHYCSISNVLPHPLPHYLVHPLHFLDLPLYRHYLDHLLVPLGPLYLQTDGLTSRWPHFDLAYPVYN